MAEIGSATPVLASLLRERYHPQEYAELGCWWVGRLLELPTFGHFLLQRAPVPTSVGLLLEMREKPGHRAERPEELRSRLQSLRWRLGQREPLTPDVLRRRVLTVCQRYQLGPVEREMLKFRAVARRSVPLYELLHSITGWSNSLLDGALAHAIRLPIHAIKSAFAPTAPLALHGLVTRSPAIVERFDHKFAVPEPLLQYLADGDSGDIEESAA